MPAKRADFYVTHATNGCLFWNSDGTPVYFATRDDAQAALDAYTFTAAAIDRDGFYVAEYGDLQAERDRLWDVLQANGGRGIELAEAIDELDRQIAAEVPRDAR